MKKLINIIKCNFFVLAISFFCISTVGVSFSMDKILGGAKAQLLKAKSMVKAVAGMPRAVARSFLDDNLYEDTRYAGAEMRFGSDKVYFVYERWDDMNEPYADEYEAEIPFLFEVFWDIGMDILPQSKTKTKVEQYFNGMRILKGGAMFAIDFGLVIKDIFKKRIKPIHLPFHANRLMYKISLTESIGDQGPGEFYDQVPVVLRKTLTDKFKFPIDKDDAQRFKEFSTSKVAKTLWEIAAEVRSEVLYSKRTDGMRKFLPIIGRGRSQFQDSDVEALIYWIKVHVGEWKVKVLEAEQKQLQPGLISLLDNVIISMKKGIFTNEVNEIETLKKAVNDFKVDEKLAVLPFPEPKVKGEQVKVGMKDLMNYFWYRFKRLTNEDYLSFYPFATVGSREARLYVDGVLLKFDRDVAEAEKYLQESSAGKTMWGKIEKLRTNLQIRRKRLRKARRIASKQRGLEESEEEEGEEPSEELGEVQEAQEAVKEMEKKLTKYIEKFRKRAASTPFIEEDKEIELAMSGKKMNPTSPRDRMILRLAQLKLVAPRMIYSRAMRLHLLSFNAIGMPLISSGGDDEDEDVEEGIMAAVAKKAKVVDKNRANIRKKFASETKEISKDISDPYDLPSYGDDEFDFEDDEFDFEDDEWEDEGESKEKGKEDADVEGVKELFEEDEEKAASKKIRIKPALLE